MSGLTDIERARAVLDHVRNFLVQSRLASTSISIDHLSHKMDNLMPWLAKVFRAAHDETAWSDAIADRSEPAPIPMLIWCPKCSERHVDEGEFATRPHHTHSCQHCGLTWRPAIVPTVGVMFLPQFKNDEPLSAIVRTRVAVRSVLLGIPSIGLTDGLIDLIIGTVLTGPGSPKDQG